MLLVDDDVRRRFVSSAHSDSFVVSLIVGSSFVAEVATASRSLR